MVSGGPNSPACLLWPYSTPETDHPYQLNGIYLTSDVRSSWGFPTTGHPDYFVWRLATFDQQWDSRTGDVPGTRPPACKTMDIYYTQDLQGRWVPSIRQRPQDMGPWDFNWGQPETLTFEAPDPNYPWQTRGRAGVYRFHCNGVYTWDIWRDYGQASARYYGSGWYSATESGGVIPTIHDWYPWQANTRWTVVPRIAGRPAQLNAIEFPEWHPCAIRLLSVTLPTGPKYCAIWTRGDPFEIAAHIDSSTMRAGRFDKDGSVSVSAVTWNVDTHPPDPVGLTVTRKTSGAVIQVADTVVSGSTIDPADISGGSAILADYRTSIAVDPASGTTHVAYFVVDDSVSGKVMYGRILAGSADLTGTVTVATGSSLSDTINEQVPDIDIDRHGNLYVAFYGDSGKIYVFKSTDGGSTWTKLTEQSV